MLVAIDEHSRHPEVEVIPSTSARVVIPRLNDIFARQDFPKVVITVLHSKVQISKTLQIRQAFVIEKLLHYGQKLMMKQNVL